MLYYKDMENNNTATTTVTAKPVNGRRFRKGVAAIKDAGGRYDAQTQTWTVAAAKWYMLYSDSDVEALSEAPTHQGAGVWTIPSTGEQVS